ncbi:MAG: type II secretion system protein [Verrucomicrobiae bacterium]|nr:type II secretion system protein [Verrucomicrobiae bacterium]
MNRTQFQTQPIADTEGFILLEVLLAIALFGIAGLGLVKALNFSARAATQSQLDIRMMMRLQSALTLASKAQQMEEYETVSDPDELGVQVLTRVEEMEDDFLTNEEGQGLQDMWVITVKAFWNRDGNAGEMEAQTWRYGPLYSQ